MKIKIITGMILLIPIMTFAQHFGRKSHPMNSSTGNLEVLQYWNNQLPEELEIYETILKIFSDDGHATYAEVISNAQYLSLYKKYKFHLLGGPILGNISENQVSVWVRSSIPAKIQLEVLSSEATFWSDTIHTNVQHDLAGVITVQGLEPSTRYTYNVVVNDTIKVSSENHYFRTPTPGDSLRIAFGSCPHRWGLGNTKLLQTIKERSPTAMLLLGDISVQDRFNNYAMHRADYLLRDFQTGWKNFASNTPIYANWDDHDYFGNDRAGIPKGFSAEDRSMVRKIFKNAWVNPYYGLDDQGIFFKTKLGSVELVMTDNRYFRGDERRPFLGQSQMQWLKDQIKNCKAPFLILSCGTMWSDYVSNGKDSWGVFDAEGREEIMKLIEDNKKAAVILISGDRHGARGFTIQRDSGFELFEFSVASLGARVGPPKSKSEWTSQLFGFDGFFGFGEFTFKKTSSNQFVTFRLIDENGSELYKKKLLHKDLISK